MRKTVFRIFFSFSLLALVLYGSGCASVSLDSTKDTASVHKINRLYIFIYQPQMPPSFSQSLAAAFKDCFSNAPVQLNVGTASPLVLDEKVYDSQIKNFHPEDVLMIKVQMAIVDQFDGYPKIVYDVSLYDAITKKREWRAIVNNSGDVAVMNRRMKEMAQSIFNQLAADGFL